MSKQLHLRMLLASGVTPDQAEQLARQLEAWAADHDGLAVENGWEVELLDEVERT